MLSERNFWVPASMRGWYPFIWLKPATLAKRVRKLQKLADAFLQS